MPVAGRKIKVRTSMDDDDSVVELSLNQSLTTFEGSGQSFTRRVMKLNNSREIDASSRTVAIREIHHRKRLPEDDEDDPDQKIRVYVIIEMRTEESSGANFRRRIYGLDPNKETNKRVTHIKRVFGVNEDGSKNEDVWLDMLRKDFFETEENAGQMFWRRKQKMIWNDEADDNEFDKNDLVAEPLPDDPKDPVMTDFVQDIVNVSSGGVAEFEIEQTVLGVTNPAQATLTQNNTKVEDAVKFTASIFFNFADGHGIPGSFDGIGSFYLLEFGGGQPGDAGSPFTSSITLERMADDDMDGGRYQFRVLLEGPVIEDDWGTTTSFYGTFLEDATRLFQRRIEGTIPIGHESDLHKLLEKWHHLAVSVDAGADFLDNDTQVGWYWQFEGDGVFGGIPNPGIAPYVDPANVTYMSPDYFQAGNAFGAPINVDLSLLPDPATMQRQRIYVHKDDGGWGLVYNGFAFTSAPNTTVADAKHCPMQMFLDGKSKMDYVASGESGKGKIIVLAMPPGFSIITAADDKEGIIVKGKQIGVPMKTDSFYQTAVNTETRLTHYQVWFDKFVDFTDSTLLARFLKVTTDPVTLKKTGRPATLTEADIATYTTLGVKPEDMLTPAALTFGKPAMLMRGSKNSFIKNKGTAGAFVKTNDIENYTPGPSKIPIL